jgi:sensor histidine kinase YesM
MTHLRVVAATMLTGALFALFGLAVVHHRLLPLEALATGGLAAVASVLLRGSWSHLPFYIGFWLDLGVVLATALLAVTGHGLATGFAFTVLRAPELGLLGTAGLLVATATTGLAYTHLRLAREVEAREHRVTELERTALESRLRVLSAQIRPHFLFNTLNTLAELVHEDEDAAEDLVTDLASMMRTALKGSTDLVPLADELDVVRRLFRIESARLGPRLQWSIDALPDDHARVRVPALSIQPLVENAIQHAASARVEGGTVHVGIRWHAPHFEVTVTDNGPGLPADIAQDLRTGVQSGPPRGTEGHGGGLWSCRERLRLTWPDGSASLHHDPTPAGTTLRLRIPPTEPTP